MTFWSFHDTVPASIPSLSPLPFASVVWTPPTDSRHSYCLLFLVPFHSVMRRLTLWPAPFICSPVYFVPLFLHSFCWQRTDALRGKHCMISELLGTATVWRHRSMPQTMAMETSCNIHLCVQWPQPGFWLQSHQTVISAAVTNFWRANFANAGPTSTIHLFDSYNCTCTHTPAMGVKGTSGRSEIIFLEDSTNPTDVNEQPGRHPTHARSSSGLEEKVCTFVAQLPENEGAEPGQTLWWWKWHYHTSQRS